MLAIRACARVVPRLPLFARPDRRQRCVSPAFLGSGTLSTNTVATELVIPQISDIDPGKE